MREHKERVLPDILAEPRIAETLLDWELDGSHYAAPTINDPTHALTYVLAQ